MNAQTLGVQSTWKMLTRDKGWIKPLLLLALVGWIPIVGQIVLLGFGLEWARLTAWGVDAAPKQRGVDFGKLFRSGGIAFLVVLTMGIVVFILNVILFGIGSSSHVTYINGASGMWMTSIPQYGLLASGGGIMFLLQWVLNLAIAVFIAACSLRAVIYDSFAAGWRVDRVAEMVRRDVSGFMHLLGVTLVFAIVQVVLVTVGFALLVPMLVISFATGYLFTTPVAVLLMLLVVVVVVYCISLVGTAISLISSNMIGQWFCRFELERWGTSSAPLPADVPAAWAHKHGYDRGGVSAAAEAEQAAAATAHPAPADTSAAPAVPVDVPAATPAAPAAEPAPVPASAPAAAVEPAPEPASPTTAPAPAPVTPAPAPAEPAVEPAPVTLAPVTPAPVPAETPTEDNDASTSDTPTHGAQQ